MANIILIADNDPDDQLLAKEALEMVSSKHILHFVRQQDELLDYLYRRNNYLRYRNKPLPDLILLDINIVKDDICKVIDEIKENPKFKRIPLVVLTNSKDEEDICLTYDRGVNSFINKPASFTEFIEVIQATTAYWLNIVALPTPIIH